MASCKPKIAKNSCTQAVSWDTETNSIRVCRRKLIIAECASHLLHCFKTYTCKQLSIGQTVNSCKQILICHPCVLDKWRLWSDGSLRHRISAMWPRANLRKTAKVFLFQIKPVQSWHCFVPIFMCKVCWTLGFWIDTDAWQETAGSSETFSSFEGGSPPVQPHEMTQNRKTFNIVWNHGHTCIHRSQFAACTTIFLSRAGLTGRPKSQPPYLEEIAWFSGATVMELPAQDKASRTDFLMSRRMAIKAANKHAYPENLRESSDCQTGAQWTLDPGRLRMFPWFPLLSPQLMAHHPKKMPTGFKWDSMIADTRLGCNPSGPCSVFHRITGLSPSPSSKPAVREDILLQILNLHNMFTVTSRLGSWGAASAFWGHKRPTKPHHPVQCHLEAVEKSQRDTCYE